MPVKETWLIDGYNLLHVLEKAGVLGKRMARRSLRELLFTRLASFAAVERHPVTVVLDGKGPAEELAPYQSGLLRIEYSQDISADAWIERHLYVNRGKSGIVVVTEDRALANLTRGNGVRVMRGADFWESVRESEKESEEVRFRAGVKSHGFHRPFSNLLKESDET